MPAYKFPPSPPLSIDTEYMPYSFNSLALQDPDSSLWIQLKVEHPPGSLGNAISNQMRENHGTIDQIAMDHPQYYNASTSNYGLDPNFRGPVYQSNYDTPATSASPPAQLTSMAADQLPATPRSRNLRSNQVNKPAKEPNPEPIQASKARKPKERKSKSEKGKVENRIARLERPLSELTKNWVHVPVVDIAAYVNRSTDERIREVALGKTPGKVKRPMNSFMLYRKAYQNRTKNWCLQNNHQVVSQVCGDSWPLEPDEIKKQFSEWARIERVNHQTAHPGYKFSPSKSTAINVPKTSKRRNSNTSLAGESSYADSETRGDQPQTPKVKKSRVSQYSSRAQYSTTYSDDQQDSRGASLELGTENHHQSSFQANNPGREPPPPYNPLGLPPGQYYEQTVRQNVRDPSIEDVFIRRTAGPSGSFLRHDLPEKMEHEDMRGYNQHIMPQSIQVSNQRIDPSLLAQDQNFSGLNYSDPHPDGAFFGSYHPTEQWHPVYGLISRDSDVPLQYIGNQFNLENYPLHDPHMGILANHVEGWKVEPLGELDAWADEDVLY